MFEETGSMVECSVCETEFDPDAAGGWCTNPDCGEWKYEGEETTEGSRDQDPLAQSGDSDESETEFTAAEIAGEPDTEQSVDGGTPDPLAGDEDTTGAEENKSDRSAEKVETDAPAEEVKEETPVDQGEDHSPDDEGDGHVDEDPAGTDDEEASGTTETDDAPAETIDCPGCGETLDTDVNFCPSCGEDVSAVEPESAGELTTCPACDESVDPGDSFCASCGENLEAHREQQELTACPDCGADVDAEDQFCSECGENLEAHRRDTASPAEETTESSDDQSAPDSLLLETRGREIAVSDGDIVGRELRKIVTETGGDENDAVRIHREHIRFVREDGEFYLVDLGENPTEVNGQSLSKGDREPIAPGDTITLSDFVTLAVTRP